MCTASAKLFDIVIRQHQNLPRFRHGGQILPQVFRLNLSDSRLSCHWLKLLLLPNWITVVTDVCGQDSHVIRDTTFSRICVQRKLKTVTDDEHCLVSGKLARNRFHTRNSLYPARLPPHRRYTRFQTCGQIIHHGLEFLDMWLSERSV